MDPQKSLSEQSIVYASNAVENCKPKLSFTTNMAGRAWRCIALIADALNMVQKRRFIVWPKILYRMWNLIILLKWKRAKRNYQLNVAKICEVLGWCFRKLELLDEKGLIKNKAFAILTMKHKFHSQKLDKMREECLSTSRSSSLS